MAVALPWISLALTAVGTGVAVAGSLEQAEVAEKAGKFNEAVANNQAKAEQDRAQFEAARLRKRNLVLLGKQRAGFAKSGVNLGGSALDVIYDSELEGQLDVLNSLYSGAVGANYQRTRGQLARMEGQNAATAARYGAASTFLTGVGRGVSQYQRNSPYFED